MATWAWLATHAERRRSPTALWPDVRSIVMLGMSYAPETNPLEALDHPTHGVISVYAQGKDYHDILKGKLKQLASRLASDSGSDVKVFVDTAPVMEKPLAAAAGLGWQGKNTMLVSRDHGSWLFLGAIFTTAELPPDAAEDDHCGSCRRCLDVCPTAAFPAPYQLRCAPLPRLPVDRAQGAHPGRVPPRHGQPRVRLRRLPCRVPVEQVRRDRARSPLPRPRRDRQSAAR